MSLGGVWVLDPTDAHQMSRPPLAATSPMMDHFLTICHSLFTSASVTQAVDGSLSAHGPLVGTSRGEPFLECLSVDALPPSPVEPNLGDGDLP